VTPYQREQLENIRRTCETARETKPYDHVDSFNHILDLVKTIKENENG
jgi:hypothetical protein